MTDSEFDLPDVGEGLTEAEIVSWRVKVGDTIEVNQVMVEIETAKSLVELPSPFSGVVTELLAAEGTTVAVGSPLIRVSSDSAGSSQEPAGPSDGDSAQRDSAQRDSAQTVADAAASVNAEDKSDEKPGAVLVGYGIKGAGSSRRRPSPTRSSPAAADAPGRVLAKPPIRRLAKDLGVDLAHVQGTGAGGEVTRDDVVRDAGQASVFRNIETPEWGDRREERIPVKGVRKVIAQTMVASAYSAPHVSLFVDVDATRTMEFVKRLKASTDFAGVKVSPLLIVAKAMIWAVRRNPTANATWTDEEIIVKHFVNLGIAAATPRGLVVPNVKDAHAMSLLELAQAIEALTITARDGKTSAAQMSDGTITITNIGVFGMDSGTPILNTDEVGILALGTIKQKPWVIDGEVRPRFVTTLAASFDHRVVDGDVASRFLADVASIIEEPALLLD